MARRSRPAIVNRRRRGFSRGALALVSGVFVAGAAYAWILGAFITNHALHMEEERISHLSKMTHMARMILDPVVVRARQGEIPVGQGRELAAALFKPIRFGDESVVMFLITNDGTVLLRSQSPESEGANQWFEWHLRDGYLIRDLVLAANENPEGGYVRYFGEPGEPGGEASRIAFVMSVPELGLNVGTGIDLEPLRAGDRRFSAQAGLLGGLMLLLVALPLAVVLLMLRARNRDLEREFATRKRVEEVMLDGEHRYRSLFDNAPVGICQTTLDGRLLRANPVMAKRLGFDSTLAMMEAKVNVLDAFYVNREDRGKILQGLRAQGEVQNVEALLQGRPGNQFWAAITARLVRDREGEPQHIESFVVDIDARKRAEEYLRVSEERYRLVSLQPDQLVWELEVATGTVALRGDVAAVTGHAPDTKGLDGLDFWVERIHPDEIGDFLAQQAEVLADKDAFQGEYRFRRADGEYVFLEFRGVVLRDDQGRATRVLGTLRDISPRKRAEQALERSEAKYRTLFESAADALFISGEDGIIVDCNPATEILFGMGREELIGRLPKDLSPETQPGGENSGELSAKHMKRALEGEVQRFPWLHRRGDGKELHAHVSLTSYGSGGARKILAMVRDMTDRWLAEEQRLRFEHIASASSDHMTFIDMNLTYLASNQAYAEALGSTPEGLLGREVADVLGPEAWAEVGEYVERARKGEVVTYSQWLNLPGVGRRFFEAYYHPYFDATGRQTGIVANRRDITNRKRIQDALLESERRYRLLAENAADVIWVMDTNMRLIYMSPAVKGFSGYTPEEVLQRQAEDFVSPRSWAEMEGALRGLAEEAGRLEQAPSREGEGPESALTRRLELSFDHKDGREMWADVLVTAIRDEEGRLEGFQGVTRDVTERKQTREALARSLRFEKIIDLCAKRLLASTAQEDVLPGVLEEIREIAGLDRVFVFINHEVEGKGTCAALVFEANVPGRKGDIGKEELAAISYDEHMPHLRDMFLMGKGTGGLVRNLPRPERDGLEGHGVRSIIVQPLMVGGNWFGFMGFHDLGRERVWDRSEHIFLETTAEMVGAYFERVQGEENLRQAHAELGQIFNSTGNGMALYDVEGRAQRVNKPMLEMFGLDPDQVRGRTCEDILPAGGGGEGCPAPADQLEFGGEGHQFSYEDPDRGTRWIAVTASPFMDVRGVPSGSVVTYRDITRRVRAQEEADRRREQLVQADKLASLGTLVSGVAHEINNPNGIISLTAPTLAAIWQGVKPMLEERFAGQGDFRVGEFSYSRVRDEVDSLFEQVVESGRRIKRIVSELKDFARQDAADLDQDVDLAEVLQAAVGLVGNKLKKATSRFKFSLPRGPVMVRGNFQRLEQVLVNVLINACEALGDTSRPIEAALSRDEEAGLAEVRVMDKGSGIADKDLKHIFDPFFTTKRDQGGTGLGLSVSHGIILEHGGSMEYLSAKGEGTTCVIRLALLRTGEQTGERAVSAAAPHDGAEA